MVVPGVVDHQTRTRAHCMHVVCAKAEVKDIKRDVCWGWHAIAGVGVEVAFLRCKALAQEGQVVPQRRPVG